MAGTPSTPTLPEPETPVADPHRRVRRRWARAAPTLLAAAGTAVYCLVSLARFARIDTPSWDNAIFEQAVRGYAHFSAPIVDIKGPGFNELGDHFSPIVALLGPVYRVFPAAQTLLVAQAALIGVSIVPIGRAAIRALGIGPGCGLAAAYGLSFGIQAAIDVGFHEVAFAAPLMAFAGEAGLRHRWRRAALWALPLLLVKEDLGVTVAAIGLIAWLAGARRAGWMLAVSGVAGTLLAVLVIVPAFNPADTFAYWSLVGAGGQPGLWHNLAAGWSTKATTLLTTFGITGFAALRSPWALAAIPTLSWRFIGSRESFWGIDWHYSLVLMPIVFIAAIDAITRFRATHRPGSLARLAARMAPKLPAAMLIGALVACRWLPAYGLIDGATWRPNPRAAAAAQAIAVIPPGSSVETNRGLVTHLVTDDRVYWVTTIGRTVTPQFVLVDTHTGNDGDLVAFAERQHPSARYRLMYARNGYRLAQLVPARRAAAAAGPAGRHAR